MEKTQPIRLRLGFMDPHLFVFAVNGAIQLRVYILISLTMPSGKRDMRETNSHGPRKQNKKLTTEQFQWLLDGFDAWKMKPFAELHF